LARILTLLPSALERGWPLFAVVAALLLSATPPAVSAASAHEAEPAQVGENGAAVHPAELPPAAVSEWQGSRVTVEPSARTRRPGRVSCWTCNRHGAAMAAIFRAPPREAKTRRVWRVHASRPTDPDPF
jgi:hypothetical protein